MNIYLCGQKFFAAEVFTALHKDGHNIVGVSSPADNGRGEPDRLRAVAEAKSVKRMKSGLLNADTMPPDVDLIVCAHARGGGGGAARGRAGGGAGGGRPS